MVASTRGAHGVSVASRASTGAQQVARRVRMRQPPAQRASVPDLRVRDGTGGLHEQQRVLVDERIAQHLVVGGHRTDHEGVAVLAHTAQLVDSG